MPVRHEGDFQRRKIKSWDSWIDEAIVEAQERGEFDNLPHHGKPLTIEDTPFAPDMAAGLRTLKNAGSAPAWMELDREITHATEEMDEFLARSAAYLRDTYAELSRHPEPEPKPARRTRTGIVASIRGWLPFARDAGAAPPRRLTVDVLAMIRARMREQYLERAAAIDKKVTQFHAALPRNLWHLERMRLTPEAAAKAFDHACPPIG